MVQSNAPSQGAPSPASGLSLEGSAIAELSGLYQEENQFLTRELGQLFGSCRVHDCPLHTPTEHLLLLYSNALFCLAHHGMDGLSDRAFFQICAFEGAVMQHLASHRQTAIQYSCLDLHCEQDIESLTFKAFLVLAKRSPAVLSNTHLVGTLLQLLYARKEYERFFQVYSMKIDRDLRIFQLALRASLKSREKESSAILAAIRNYLGLSDTPLDPHHQPASCWANLLNSEHLDIDPLQLPLAEKQALYHSTKLWFNQRYKDHHWNLSLEKWRASKTTEGSSEAMLDICVKFKEHEQGWLIYKESLAGNLHTLRVYRLSSRVIYLIAKAINHRSSQCWTERFLEVSTVISRLPIDKYLKIKNTFSVLRELDSYAHLAFLAGSVIQQYPDHLISSPTVSRIFGDVVYLAQKHQPAIEQELARGKLPDLFRYAATLYALWKQKTAKGIFSTLFFGRPRECLDVYALFLQATILLKLPAQSFSVCQDLWESGVEVSPSISGSLLYLHPLVCHCNDFTEDTACSRKFLTHILSKSPKH